MASYFPLVGAWYKDRDTSQHFEIVAIDEKHKTIEVQYFDGDISEFDIETWGQLSVNETEAPQEAFAGCDDLSSFTSDTNKDMDFNVQNPLEWIEPEVFSGFDDLF